MLTAAYGAADLTERHGWTHVKPFDHGRSSVDLQIYEDQFDDRPPSDGLRNRAIQRSRPGRARCTRARAVAHADEGSPEAEDGAERVVDAPQLFGGQATRQVSEAPGIDGAELLDQDPRGGALDLDLGPERCSPGASGMSARRGRPTVGGAHRLGRRRRDARPAVRARRVSEDGGGTRHPSARIDSISSATASISRRSSSSASSAATSAASTWLVRRRSADAIER